MCKVVDVVFCDMVLGVDGVEFEGELEVFVEISEGGGWVVG